MNYGGSVSYPIKRSCVKQVMTHQTTKIAVSSIILDETIYPRKGIDQKMRQGTRPGGPMKEMQVSALWISERPLGGQDELWIYI